MEHWFRILLGKRATGARQSGNVSITRWRQKITSGDDMQNWKRAVIAGSVGTVAILLLKGRRPAAVLASEYPDQFARIREELPSYVRQGTRFLDLAIKIGSKIEELAEGRAALA